MTSPAEKPPRAGASPWPTMRAPLRNSTRTRSMPASAGIGTETGNVLADQQRAVHDQPVGEAVRAEDLGLQGKAQAFGQAAPARDALDRLQQRADTADEGGILVRQLVGQSLAPNTRPSTMVCRQSSARSPRRSGRGISRHAPSPPWPTSTAAHHSAFAPCAISFDPASGSAPAA